MGKFYAVHVGLKPGIYKTWKECQKQVDGFSGAVYKSFKTEEEANVFLNFGHAKCATAEHIDEKTLREVFADELSDTEPNETCSSKRLKRKAETLLERINTSKLLKKEMKKIDSNDFTFTTDEKNYPIVFTDGACSNNGKNSTKVRAGYGVFWGDEHPLNLSKRLDGIQTNQRAEIAAINACLEQAKIHGLENLTIKTDSQFVINCITKWVPGWIKRKWIKRDGKAVVHKNEFIAMLEYLKSVNVNWIHVRGHMGVYGNEMADKLAVAGSQM